MIRIQIEEKSYIDNKTTMEFIDKDRIGVMGDFSESTFTLWCGFRINYRKSDVGRIEISAE